MVKLVAIFLAIIYTTENSIVLHASSLGTLCMKAHTIPHNTTEYFMLSSSSHIYMYIQSKEALAFYRSRKKKRIFIIKYVKKISR